MEKRDTIKGIEAAYKSLFLPHPEKMMALGLALLVFSLGVLAWGWASTGEILHKGIDFAGGTRAEIVLLDKNVDPASLENKLSKDLEDVSVRIIESGNTTILSIESTQTLTQDEIEKLLEKENILFEKEGITIHTVGPAISKQFWLQAIIAIIVSFVLMASVVFYTFRNPVPSLAIILAAIVDITFAMAVMRLAGIELSLASLAGLLTLIGYSVDTDILLTTRVLKRRDEGPLDERIAGAMSTGINMTTTSLLAFIVLFLVSTSRLLDSIAIVIASGLLADYASTWLLNAGILKKYAIREELVAEEKEKKKPRYERRRASKKKTKKKK